ncbi:MAG: hypothetical protein Q7R76_06015 [Candidatus Woesearchaeota archaeon]|nr:hypothetical protein [Candidatus Woesearchaeota archaeon]
MKKIGTFIKDFFKQYIKWIILVLLGIGVLLFFKKIMVMAVFLALNAFIALVWMYFQNRVVAIELITLTSFLCFYAFGTKAGVFFMFLTLLVHNFITTNMSINNALNIVLSPALLWALSLVKSLGIVWLGIAHVVIINALFFLLVLFFQTGQMHKRIIYLVTHLAWNIFLFMNFAEVLLKLFI